MADKAESKSKKISLDSSMLDKALEEIKALDEKITGVIGTAAEMKKKAEAAVTEAGLFVEVPSEVTDNLTQFVAVLHNPEALKETEGKVSAHTVDLLSMAVSLLTDHVSEARDTAVTLWLKENSQDSGPGLDALRTKRDGLVEQLQALAVIFKQPLEGNYAIPSAPRSKASRSGSGGAVKVSGAHYYKVENGTKNYISEGQNKVSSVAFYWSEKLVGEKLGSDQFAEWAKKNHSVDVKQATPWSITNNGITVGMDVLSDTNTEGAAATEPVAGTEVKEETPAS